MSRGKRINLQGADYEYVIGAFCFGQYCGNVKTSDAGKQFSCFSCFFRRNSLPLK